MEILRRITEKGNPSATTALTACLEDRLGSVRSAAVRALREIAEKGNATVILAVSWILDCKQKKEKLENQYYKKKKEQVHTTNKKTKLLNKNPRCIMAP